MNASSINCRLGSLARAKIQAAIESETLRVAHPQRA
jgi:hypothetical protein